MEGRSIPLPDGVAGYILAIKFHCFFVADFVVHVNLMIIVYNIVARLFHIARWPYLQILYAPLIPFMKLAKHVSW